MTFEIATPPTLDAKGQPCSFAFLKTLRDGAVQHIITDPPYPDFVQNNMKSGTAFKRWVDSGAGGSVPNVTLPFEALSDHAFAADMVRVAERWVLSFCAVESFGEFRRVSPEHWVRGGIWYKPNSMGMLRGDRPASAYEGIAIMHRRTKKIWQGRGSFAYWQAEDEYTGDSHFVCNGTRGEDSFASDDPSTTRHPNQKPLALCLELVAKFTRPGELVLDLFAGSGRIGEACVLLGRDYLGLERDPAWAKHAAARLALALTWPRLTDESCLQLCAAPKPAESRALSGLPPEVAAILALSRRAGRDLPPVPRAA